ncbi:hypothetical protein EX30DRAFT_121481 [Ascodesmis nigricans]|uniref:Uncharacterized protein n=1 Tax=Ascodesmis nigricans TaxID=341454 RepID=A0A4S2MPN7_9PEZI|nr:hypothetical protein EX30DRAFT_121481 [Ascodesmis nigricans]
MVRHQWLGPSIGCLVACRRSLGHFLTKTPDRGGISDDVADSFRCCRQLPVLSCRLVQPHPAFNIVLTLGIHVKWFC